MSPFKVINPPEAASPCSQSASRQVKSSRLAGEQLAGRGRVGPLTHYRLLEPLALYSVRDATRVALLSVSEGGDGGDRARAGAASPERVPTIKWD